MPAALLLLSIPFGSSSESIEVIAVSLSTLVSHDDLSSIGNLGNCLLIVVVILTLCCIYLCMCVCVFFSSFFSSSFSLGMKRRERRTTIIRNNKMENLFGCLSFHIFYVTHELSEHR